MVPPSDALTDRADEEGRQNFTRPPRVDPQLFSRPERVLQRRNRGSEQQSKSHYEKILRVPNLPRHRTGALSFTWQTARAGTHPQILLTNHIFRITPKRKHDGLIEGQLWIDALSDIGVLETGHLVKTPSGFAP